MANNGLTLSVTGLKEAQDELLKLPEKLRTRVWRGALNSGAKLIADRAKILVPFKTGATEDSIIVRPAIYRGSGDGLAVAVTAGVPPKRYKSLAPMTVRNGKAVHPYWALYLEYGFRRGKRSKQLQKAQKKAMQQSRARLKGANVANLFGLRSSRDIAAEKALANELISDSRPMVPARPFMRPAFDMEAQNMINEVAAYVRGNLDKLYARNERKARLAAAKARGQNAAADNLTKEQRAVIRGAERFIANQQRQAQTLKTKDFMRQSKAKAKASAAAARQESKNLERQIRARAKELRAQFRAEAGLKVRRPRAK